MPEVIGIRFQRAGRVYYFDPTGIELEVNDRVVVETPRGPEVGWVVISPKQVLTNELTEPLKPILRKAEPEDLRQKEELQIKEREALAQCQEMVKKFQLPMKFLAAEYNLDGSRLTFFFGAEGRVDFRQLLRELNATFKTRVELRQVGPRDEAKLLGGLGRCGRPLCCASYLLECDPISIRMAKEQDLPLNPLKISGLCGRLLCCLGYEYEQYRVMKKNLPRAGERVSTPIGPALVVGGNPLKETVSVELESQVTVELPLLEVIREEAPSQGGHRNKRRPPSPSE